MTMENMSREREEEINAITGCLRRAWHHHHEKSLSEMISYLCYDRRFGAADSIFEITDGEIGNRLDDVIIQPHSP